MTKEFRPLVSIVIPVYNGSNYLRQAIDSALAQTYDNIEILVINDGSTDNGATHDIAMFYGDNIRYFHKEHGGVISALNFGIENMNGDFFSWLSDNCIYMAEKIDRQIYSITRAMTPEMTISFCNCIFTNSKDEELFRSNLLNETMVLNHRDYLFLGNIGFHGAMMLIPKKLLKRLDFASFMEKNDYDLWLEISNIAQFVIDQENLAVISLPSYKDLNNKRHNYSAKMDNFIGKGIKNIPVQEYEVYIKAQMDKCDTNHIIEIVKKCFQDPELPIIASQAIKQLRSIFYNSKDSLLNYSYSLLGHSDIDELKKCRNQRYQSSKLLTVVYCDNLTDNILNEMLFGLALLSPQSEIIFFYQTSDACHLEHLRSFGISMIAIDNNGDNDISLRLAILCYLLDAKLFWYNSEAISNIAHIFNYLSTLKINSLASFLDINMQDPFAIERIDQNYNLAKASLITSKAYPLGPSKLIYGRMICISDNKLHSLGQWKKIINSLMSINEYCEYGIKSDHEIMEILETGYDSTADYIQDYIRNFLNEVSIKESILNKSYEQRRFWKLTKPLRTLVRFSRKANQAIKRIIKKELSIRTVLYYIKLEIKNRRLSS